MKPLTSGLLALWLTLFAGGIRSYAASIVPVAQDSLANGDVRELSLSAPEGARVEFFRLDPPSSAAASTARNAPGVARPIGVVRWISGNDINADTGKEGGWRADSEVTLFAEGTRVHHTERILPTRRELVFREVRPRAGRTLRLSWTPDGSGVSIETAGGQTRQRTHDLSRGGAFPLALVEVMRSGGNWPDEVAVFQPLAGSFEVLEVESDVTGSTRRVDLSRQDGTCAGRYVFEDESLVSFQWQDGGPVAIAIEGDEYRALLDGQASDDETGN